MRDESNGEICFVIQDLENFPSFPEPFWQFYYFCYFLEKLNFSQVLHYWYHINNNNNNNNNNIKNLTKDIKNLVSLKYLCEYENTIKETFEEPFDTETLVKTEIVKYYIDNLYVSSSS